MRSGQIQPCSRRIRPSVTGAGKGRGGKQVRERTFTYTVAGQQWVHGHLSRGPRPQCAATAAASGPARSGVLAPTPGQGHGRQAHAARVWSSTRRALGRGSVGEAAPTATGMARSCCSVAEDIHRRQGAHHRGPPMARRSGPWVPSVVTRPPRVAETYAVSCSQRRLRPIT